MGRAASECLVPLAARDAMGIHASYMVHAQGPGDPSDRVSEYSRRARGVPVWAAPRSLSRILILLGRLQAVAADETAARDVAGLRREAETRPLAALTRVVARALALDDGLCWDSLARGDEAAFSRQARVGADLREFSVCAGLLADP